MSWYKPADLGFGVRRQLAGLGYGARLFGRLDCIFPLSIQNQLSPR